MEEKKIMTKKKLSKWKADKLRKMAYKQLKAGMITKKTYFGKLKEIRKNSDFIYKGVNC